MPPTDFTITAYPLAKLTLRDQLFCGKRGAACSKHMRQHILRRRINSGTDGGVLGADYFSKMGKQGGGIAARNLRAGNQRCI
jgi:hypothetical protein